METILPPQPPPDAPAPPPGPEAVRSQAKMKWIVRMGVGCLLLTALIGLNPPTLIKQRQAADRTEAIINLKQLNLALIEFDNDYGAFPDLSTLPAVTAATSTTLPLGSSTSNELLRQLIATGITNERIFWAKSAITPSKPNGRLGSDALAKGECAFTYIAGISSSSDPGAPVLVAPVIPGTWKFDPKPFARKAVILRADGSVKAETIDKNGHVMIGGMNLFDPRQPYWRGKAPDIKWPE